MKDEHFSVEYQKKDRSKTIIFITFIHIYLYTYVFDCHCQKVWLITFSPVSINNSVFFFASLETWEINQLKTVTGHFQHHWSTFSILHQDIKIYRYSVFLFYSWKHSCCSMAWDKSGRNVLTLMMRAVTVIVYISRSASVHSSIHSTFENISSCHTQLKYKGG